MLRKIHKVILVCLMIFCVSFGPKANAYDNSAENNSLQHQMELIQHDVKVDDLNIEPINTKDLKKKEVPNTKKEGTVLLFLFLKVMGFVLLASGILFVIFLLIKKYRSSDFIEVEYDEYATLDLATPTTKQDAFMSFLSRTSI